MKLLKVLHDFLYAERSRNPGCTFCGKRWKEIGKLMIEGHGKKYVYICEPCVNYCCAVIEAEKKRHGLPSVDDKTPVSSPDSTHDKTSEPK